MTSAPRPPYNERLFRSGVRKRFHLARFQWVAHTVRALGIPADAVLELGCFDGRLLDHLPRPPSRYKGFDANWEGGLDQALASRGGAPGREFFRAARATEIALDPGERFDLAVCLETLEHVPPEEVEPYLRLIARHLDGTLLITVPNEIGPVFLLKWFVKRFGCRGGERYGWADVINAFLGRTDRIQRHEHKGFDDRKLAAAVAEHFDIVSVSGHPFGGKSGWLPARLCPGIGIVALSRKGPGNSVRLPPRGEPQEAAPPPVKTT